MRYRFLAPLLALLFCLPAAAAPKYFGYFANNSWQPENQDHTNVTLIWTGGEPHQQWDSVILSELAQAKAYGNKAIIIVSSYVLDVSPGTLRNDPNARAQFNDLVDKLVANGYLVPGNPAASTVLSFYPVDEPERVGLDDQNGGAHPALVNAVQAIRANPATAGFPVSTIVSKDYARVRYGIHLFDWAGLDYYSTNDPQYRDALAAFTNTLYSTQRVISVPQAGINGDLDQSTHNPEFAFVVSQENERVIMLMPFLWARDSNIGVRDLPYLRGPYTAIGHQIKKGFSRDT